ncbi:MAG: acetoacetate--CoA ligase [Gammaproteobacteria bacterium]|nr:acetoacetate--CoA ligase [Gammaproteobacteria bacterium]MDH4253328.1 acetoacetate--CoA ligase [Gammaproteobacteria bacterium]MDH5309937.1 acetoacetate--CoA ligase [Gammaproteobacteria bacterium]
MIGEGQLLWKPLRQWLADANITAYMAWLGETRGLSFGDYADLQRWSVENLDDFWASIWEYFDIRASAPYTSVLGRRQMPGAEWFPGARLNYAEHIFRSATDDAPALLYASENADLADMSWAELETRVRSLACWLTTAGVGQGDRVAAYLTNSPEAVVAMLATTSIGAVWTAVSPDFGTPSVLDRFAQLEPKVLFYADSYQYGGKRYQRLDDVRKIVAGLASLEHLVHVPGAGAPGASAARDEMLLEGATRWRDALATGPSGFRYAQVPFGHPLWILFSSGTTGIPKAIVHSHGGILIEQLKLISLHFNMKRGERLFFYTTLGWMMWNFLVSSMLLRIIPVLYDGNPNYPNGERLWELVEASRANLFGASPTFVQMQQGAGIVPRDKFDLTALQSVMLAGSPVSAECMAWFYDNVKEDVWLMPGSGGTDICSGFVGGVPGPNVYAGEIQGVHLGVDAHAFDEEGKPVINEVGELVITQPMPSMPICFWNDPGDQRYRETYFDTYPGVWRHGDFFMINERGGCFVLGRSDATLNRYGIRIGTAEIYRAMEAVEEVDDSLIVNLDLPGGRFFMPMFVKLKNGFALNDDIEQKIRRTLRERYTPRHVPEKIYQVDDIPYTLTGKKMEVPVRRILMGTAVEKAANPSVMRNPESLDYFIRFAEERTDYSLG